MSGPLAGIRVLELAGLAPVPHAAMVLADLGADVVRIARPGYGPAVGASDPLLRGRENVVVDLKTSAGRESLLGLVDQADVLLEGNRPGVMERLGLGPVDCQARNPRLIYGRLTGWGQTGPLASRAGHDINYVSLTGALNAIGPADGRPAVPLNVVADMGGGSMFLVAGVLAALLERQRSGVGEVIDVAMMDGVASLTQTMWSLRAKGQWTDDRAANELDSGAPYYDTYRCSDGRFMAVGALEPQFYAELINGLGLDPRTLPDRDDRAQWPALRELLARVFATRSRNDWVAIFRDTDACVTPVLTFSEALENEHTSARETFATVGGVAQAGSVFRLSRSGPSELVAARDVELTYVERRWRMAAT